MGDVILQVTDDDAMRAELEHAILAIWVEAMEIPDIRVDDDFFALGGHSLFAIEITENIRALLKTDRLPINLFVTSTVATLTDSILVRLHAGTAV